MPNVCVPRRCGTASIGPRAKRSHSSGMRDVVAGVNCPDIPIAWNAGRCSRRGVMVSLQWRRAWSVAQVERAVAMRRRDAAGAAIARGRHADVARERARERRLRFESAVEREVDERLRRRDEPLACARDLSLPDVAGRRLAGDRGEDPVEMPRRRAGVARDRGERGPLEEMRLDEVDAALDAIERVVDRVACDRFRHDPLLAQVPVGRLCRACGVNGLTSRSGLRGKLTNSLATARETLWPRPCSLSPRW